MDTFALKFDSSAAVNTDLAQEYLKNNDIVEILAEDPDKIPSSVLHRRLAQRLVENTELFCQLEYLANKAPAHDVRNNISLLEQNLNFHHRKYVKNNDKLSTVHLSDDSPLAVLGYVTLVSQDEVCKLHSTKQRAAAYLFTKLCHEVGLKNVGYDPVVKPELYKWRLPTGCTGVIAERSDLDSAVDAFLSSTTTGFWRLNRILVQENIYETFRKAVQWKRGLKTHPNTVLPEELRALSAASYVYNDKCLLIDYAGEESVDLSAHPHVIYVEAYRTNKELLVLIAKYGDSCLSLWSSDVAESNEITYAVESRLVWVNDFGNFDGPPAASQWFYTNCLPEPCSSNNPLITEQMKLWQKYDNVTRFNKIYKALEVQETCEYVSKVQDEIIKLNSNATIDISKNRVCVTINLPVGVTKYPKECTTTEAVVDVIELLINGNAVVISRVHDDFKPLLQALQKAGVPAIFPSSNEPLQVTSSCCAYRTRVILSNFGTIFAN